MLSILPMKLTNKMNLPQAVFDAVAADPYSKGESDFSVTELIDLPRKRALEKMHFDEIEEDVSDRLWSLYGQVMHSILERANTKAISEKRFFGDFDGYIVSGQIDSLCLENGILVDYKFTTATGFISDKPIKKTWIQQLNMQLELLRMNGLDAKQLEIIGLLRDWQVIKADLDPKYPNSQIARHVIPIWPREKTQSFIRERIKAHVDAMTELPLCPKADLWDGKRCKFYCDVSGFCEQYQTLKGEKSERSERKVLFTEP